MRFSARATLERVSRLSERDAPIAGLLAQAIEGLTRAQAIPPCNLRGYQWLRDRISRPGSTTVTHAGEAGKMRTRDGAFDIVSSGLTS
jgi:hypothetical protein